MSAIAQPLPSLNVAEGIVLQLAEGITPPTHLTETLPHEVALNQNVLANGLLRECKAEKAG